MRFVTTLCALTLLGSIARSAQESPYCAADINFDNQLDFFDVSEFLDLYAFNDPAADLNSDGSFDFFDVSVFLTLFLDTCPDLTDSDSDRIPDFAESDDGIYAGIMRTGTDPLNPDTDNDGITDGDEALGTADGLELPALGADPLRRDIFLECDWYAGDFNGFKADYRPTDQVAQWLTEAFHDAPVTNPYGGPMGVNLHLDYGQGGAFVNGEQLPGEPIFLFFDFDFNIIKAQHFDDNRRGYFHYAIFAHRYSGTMNNSSGVAEQPGNDFMVTLSTYGTPVIQANTIMHELGHNLGLRHGGFEERNWKPNYNSIMNYRYQFAGIDMNGDALGDGVLDYSIGRAPSIDEQAVEERLGIDGTTPIDWNENGSIDDTPYAANINCEFIVRSCGEGINCADNTCDVLRDQNDWNSIDWSRLTASSDRIPRPKVIECDNTP